MWQSSTGLGGHSKQQTIHKMASSWRFPDSEWTHGHDHRHGWALGKQIVPQHVFGEDDENKRGFYMQIGILKVKSLNLGLWLYIIGFLIWVMGPFALAITTCTRYKLHITIKIINMAPVHRLYLRLLTSVASPPASPPAAEHSSRALVCTAVVAPFFLASLHTCVHEDGRQAP